MKKIASHDNVEIFTPENSRFSFLKSPYAAHMTFSAVDIYYGSFGGTAFSPVDGKIIDIRSFNSPTPFRDKNSKEYVIAISQGDYVVKILHVKPEVPVGERVSKGDKLGRLIHNGYFIFWNDPVMHVEVRKPGDYLRASNNLSLTPNIEWGGLSLCKTLKLRCNVEVLRKNYALLSSKYEMSGDISGFAIGGGFIDGYVALKPENGFFGIIRPEGFYRPEVSNLEITKGGTEVLCAGIAFCLSLDKPSIKVIPLKYGDVCFSLGDDVDIRLGINP